MNKMAGMVGGTQIGDTAMDRMTNERIQSVNAMPGDDLK